MVQLIAALVGALFGVLMGYVFKQLHKLREYKSLLRGVIAECDYNLGILDEIAEGVSEGRGSFKRVKTDFFAEMRKASYQYRPTSTFFEVMAQVACDTELFNRELDELKVIEPTTQRWHDTAKTALHAKLGVYGSLNRLKEVVDSEISMLKFWRMFV